MNEINLLVKSIYLMICPINNFINLVHEKLLISSANQKTKDDWSLLFSKSKTFFFLWIATKKYCTQINLTKIIGHSQKLK